MLSRSATPGKIFAKISCPKKPEAAFNYLCQNKRESGSGTAAAAISIPANPLTTQAQLLDDLVVRVNVAALEIIQEFPSARDQYQQTSTRIVIFLVNLEMSGKLIDTLRKQRDLDL